MQCYVIADSFRNELTNYMRGSFILFDNNVTSSDWDVKHFQHP